MGAVAAETVTGQQWRLIARVGYQLLDDGGLTYGQQTEIDVCIAWAESNVDEPTVQMRDKFMQAWGLPDTKEGYRVAVYRLLDLLADTSDTRTYDSIPPGQILYLVEHYLEQHPQKPKSEAFRWVDKVLGKKPKDKFTLNKFKTIEKPIKLKFKDKEGKVRIHEFERFMHAPSDEE